jgi:predicted transcriptional regulator
MASKGITHLPVIAGGVQVGGLAAGTVLKAASSRRRGMMVEDAMDAPFPTVEESGSITLPGASLVGSGALVVTRGNRAVGVVTTTDVINYLAGR